MNLLKNKFLFSIIFIGITVIIIWNFIVIQELISTPDVLEITAQNVGMIRFADNVGGKLSEPTKMIFDWTRKVIEIKGNQVIIQTKYDYRDIVTDETFWITEFNEKIDKTSRKYIDKQGYFMWPDNLEKKDYDVYDIGGTVLHYSFEGVDEIDGIEVYRFSGKTTFDVSDVYPDFPEQIFEDYSATNYIEPVTGLEISFSEEFIDYAIVDDQKVVILDAWDTTTNHSQTTLVKQSKHLQSLYYFYKIIVPFIFVMITTGVFMGTLQHTRLKEEHKQLIFTQKELEKTQTELTKTEKLATIGSLSSKIAHDIRNPLSIIRVTLENIRMMYGTDKTKQKQFDKVERSIDRIAHQVEDVMDFVKKPILTLEKINISEVIQESLDYTNMPKNIKLVLPKKDVELICDKARLGTCLNNLILNSIQAIEGKGLIVLSVDEKKDSVIIEIEDSGSGIPKEGIDDVFEPLFTTKQQGTGLGLASVRSIINAHGGTISVTSPPTIFKIILPKG